MVRLGLIGCGTFGSILADACASLPEARLVAACSGRLENARRLASRVCCDTAGSIDELLDRDDIDAVMIATPNDLHADHAVRVLSAGKAAFVEKPMALTVSDCDRMIRAAQDAQLPLMVGHVMRFFDGIVSLKEIVDGNRLGQIHSASAIRLEFAWSAASQSPWRANSSRSGGALFTLHVHDIDLLLWLVGSVATVCGRHTFSSDYSSDSGFEIFESTLALVNFDSGASGVLESGIGFYLPECVVRLHGTDGGAEIDIRDGRIRLVLKGEQTLEVPLHQEKQWSDALCGAVASELRLFTEVVRGSVPPPHLRDLFDGSGPRAAVGVAEAIVRSHRVSDLVATQK